MFLINLNVLQSSSIILGFIISLFWLYDSFPIIITI